MTAKQKEEEICSMLRVFCEEWGKENLLLHLPVAWKDFPHSLKVDLRFDTKNSVIVEAYHEGGYQRYEADASDLIEAYSL